MRIFSLYLSCTYIIYLKKEEVIMPRFDQKGPENKGPRTGRGLGKCNGNNNADNSREGSERFGGGRGRGNGRGLGKGRYRD